MSQPSPSAAARSRRLSRPLAFALAAAIVGLALFASATPSPLYGDYAARWHFSTVVLTLVYGTYAAGVLTTLLVAGRISDELGRRRVLIAALGGLLVSTLLFMAARSVAWLFAARALQGLATGVALGAAGAALLDHAPGGDARHAGLVNGIASGTGIATGALVSGLLVQYAPLPRVTPYALLFLLFAVALAGTLALPGEPGESARWRLQPARPRVPRAMRRTFALASGGVIASWSVAGLYLALGPALIRLLAESDSHVTGGVAIFALSAPASLVQFAARGTAAVVAIQRGAAVMAAGVLATVLSLSLAHGAAAAFLAATALTGLGFGAAFLGAIRSVSAAAPPEHRASVMSAFYVVAYGAISLPAVLAGLAAPSFGLEPTFRVFGAAVAAVALVTAASARMSAPPAAARASTGG